MTDQEVRAAHGIDKDARFRAFFATENARLVRLGTMLTGDDERGADLAQETFVRLYRHWHRVRNGDPAPYARSILVNLVRSAHRRSLLERKHAPRPPEAHAGHSEHIENWLRVSQALKTLSPIRRATIVLRFYEDLTENEIARILDRPVSTVKSDIRRGLARLRPLLDGPESGGA